MLILISWLLMKPADLDPHYFQKRVQNFESIVLCALILLTTLPKALNSSTLMEIRQGQVSVASRILTMTITSAPSPEHSHQRLISNSS